MNAEITAFLQAKTTEDLYVLVRWPWVQELMEYDWFRQECLLHQAFDDQEYLSSAYFVPATRLMEIEDSKTGV